MAEAMEKFTLDFNCRTILIDVVREIDRVDVKEMSRDTSGTRAFSQFLIEVAERLPEQLQPCLVLLMKHLDGESYMLRKSILGIFGEIIIKLYSHGKLEETAKNARDQVISILSQDICFEHSLDLFIPLQFLLYTVYSNFLILSTSINLNITFTTSMPTSGRPPFRSGASCVRVESFLFPDNMKSSDLSLAVCRIGMLLSDLF